jgi:hypothetical protein
MAELEDRLAARSAELAANKQLIQESEAREEAAFQVGILKILFCFCIRIRLVFSALCSG